MTTYTFATVITTYSITSSTVTVTMPSTIASSIPPTHNSSYYNKLPINWTSPLPWNNSNNDVFANSTNYVYEDLYSLRHNTPITVAIVTILVMFILAVIIGNCFVILAVLLVREMRTLTNALIASLATADLLVALLVMPFSMLKEIWNRWPLGSIICDLWTTSDIFCCTASILNIVVIALDRYWLITKNVRYTHDRRFSRRRACAFMVFAAWVTSGVISASPLLGWRRGDEKSDPGTCMISQDLSYTIFSTFGAFWFPLSLILAVYFRIFRIARRRARNRARQRAIHPSVHSTIMSEHNGATSPRQESHYEMPTSRPLKRRQRRPRTRLRSSARTLGLIIGAFIFCWLPFFVQATIIPFCPSCAFPPILNSIVLWLGYSNSLLNPAIYAIWDIHFRRAFGRLATCDIRCSTII